MLLTVPLVKQIFKKSSRKILKLYGYTSTYLKKVTLKCEKLLTYTIENVRNDFKASFYHSSLLFIQVTYLSKDTLDYLSYPLSKKIDGP